VETVKSKIEKTAFWNALSGFLQIGLIISGVLVACITFAAVIARAMNINLLGYEEILIICAFWLYMFGTAYGSYEDSHIKADILVVMMREGIRKDIVAIIRNTLSVVLGIIFLLWALQLFFWTVENGQQTPVWRIPVTISQSSILFGLTVASFYHIVYLYKEIRDFINIRIRKKVPNGSTLLDGKGE
jgi:TRAP-type C4-dicarboxylate transport system permease small subunit